MATDTNGTALAVRGLTDKQIQTRIDLNRKAGYGLEKATPAQLNLIFLYCQKYQLLPGDDVTLYENRVWFTLLGSVKLMRRHSEYRGFECKPLSAADKAEWGYDPDDIVVECQIRTDRWGTISARGKVSKEERAGLRVEGRRLNFVAGIHPVEMAEKRAIQRAERLAFGADAMIDEDEIEQTARLVVEERNDPARVAADAANYSRIYGGTEDEYDHLGGVETRSAQPAEQPAREPDAGNSGSRGPVMVTSKRSSLWTDFSAARAQALAENIDVPELDLPQSEESLRTSTAELHEAIAAARAAIAQG